MLPGARRTVCVVSKETFPALGLYHKYSASQLMAAYYTGPKREERGFPMQALGKPDIVGSMGSPSTAKFALTLFSISAVVLHVHAPEWVL